MPVQVSTGVLKPNCGAHRTRHLVEKNIIAINLVFEGIEVAFVAIFSIIRSIKPLDLVPQLHTLTTIGGSNGSTYGHFLPAALRSLPPVDPDLASQQIRTDCNILCCQDLPMPFFWQLVALLPITLRSHVAQRNKSANGGAED